MWPAAAAAGRSINYGYSQEMGGMLGLRDLYVVAPASSFHHHHHHHHHHDPSVMNDPHSVNSSNPATALGVGVTPLLTATPCLGPAANIGADNNETTLMSNRSRGGAIQLWQDQESEHGHYLKKQGITMFELNDSSGNLAQNENGLTVSATNSGGATCQDCGNQAKKDCTYRRCRTCCKSRNYDCPTHVKSTWVPESRRRERRLMAAAAAATTAGGSTGATSGVKKPRLVTSQQQTTTNSHTSTSNTTPPRSFDTGSSHQDAGFKESLPGQIRVPAVFKCVRVSAVAEEAGQDEFAYQATVKICGHVFKGFLYDQGVEGRDVYPNMSELHLGGGGTGGGRGGGNVASSSSPMLDPSDVYAASGGGGLLGGGPTYGHSFVSFRRALIS